MLKKLFISTAIFGALATTSAIGETCNAGYYDYNGTCTACPAGTYQDEVGATSCKDIPPGYYASWGSINFSSEYGVCEEAFTARTKIYPCDIGKYCPGGTAGLCYCGNGYTTEGVGATSWEECIPITQPCADGYTELRTGNGLVFKAWAQPATEHSIVLQRAGSDVQCYVNLVAGAADNAINVSIGDDIYHTSD